MKILYSILLSSILFMNNISATTYEVGPGKPFTSITQIATHALIAGDTIKVFYQPTPYYEKFLLHGIGTAANPIVLMGIPDVNGNKPIIDGTNAVTNLSSNYWNEDRQLILIGQSGSVQSDYIIVDGFEISGANNFNNFTDDQGTSGIAFQANAAGIRVSWGKNVTIRNCDITGNGIGLQTGEEDDQNLVIEYCHIYDNGVCTWYNSFIHNLYLSSGNNSVLTLQYSHIGELLSSGQQIKSRAQTTVIRYNWIEGGRNSSLDLVESVANSQNYVSDAYVYGNVIIKPDSSDNSRIIHFGSDNSGHYRLGTCYFYNNTCVIKDTRTWGTKRIFNLSDSVANLIADNNIFFKANASTYDLNFGFNNITGSNNWFTNNINNTNTLSNTIIGTNPDFVNQSTEDYHLNPTSPCIDIVSSYNFPAGHNLSEEYVKHMQSVTRPVNGNLDLGAFELGVPLSLNKDPLQETVNIFPNPSNGEIQINAKAITSVQVIGLNGKTVFKEALASSNHVKLDLTILPIGMYFLKIETNAEQYIQKIIID